MTSMRSCHPAWDEADIEAALPEIAEVLRSGQLILGKNTQQLEQRFAKLVGTKYAVALSSASAALDLALGPATIGHVLMPSNNCAAVAASVSRQGYQLKFCEIDERDFCIDVDDALERMNGNTAAVLVTHLAGFVPHDFEQLVDKCAERGIPLIEDCSHAHGTRLHDRHVGSFGIAGCFSLYPTKIINAGGVGGILTTNDRRIYSDALERRHHGASGGIDLSSIVSRGNNLLMDEVRAALARRQLERLEDYVAARRAVAAEYSRCLSGYGWLDEDTRCPETDIRPLTPSPGSHPAFYKYPVVLPEGAPPASVVRTELRRRGIEAGTLYDPPIHRQPAFQIGVGFPVTEQLIQRQVCLPIHHKVDPSDCCGIVENLLECLE